MTATFRLFKFKSVPLEGKTIPVKYCPLPQYALADTLPLTTKLLADAEANAEEDTAVSWLTVKAVTEVGAVGKLVKLEPLPK